MISRRKIAIALAATPVAIQAHDENANPALDRVALIHGATGPFAVAGYRMGFAALLELKLRRGSFDLEVIHHAPREVQWSCIVDGLQAATGASLGKLNLSLVPAAKDKVYSIVKNRSTGQSLRLDLTPAFIKEYLNVPMDKLAETGAKLADTPEEKIFKIQIAAR